MDAPMDDEAAAAAEAAATAPAPLPAPPPADPRSLATVAPAWHTGILLAFLIGFSLLGASPPPAETSGGHGISRPVIYATVFVFQWILFTITWWGLRLRGVSVGSVIAYRWKGWSGVGRCLLLSAVCWIATFFVLTQGLDATGMRDPDQVRRIVEMIVPRGPLELTLWMGVALTAGFVEEFVFRGYLQRQFSAWTRNHLLGAGLTAVVFGVGHIYQGLGSAVLIMSAGFAMSLFAYAFRSIAPGMVAHAFEDVISGIFGRG